MESAHLMSIDMSIWNVLGDSCVENISKSSHVAFIVIDFTNSDFTCFTESDAKLNIMTTRMKDFRKSLFDATFAESQGGKVFD